MRTPIHLVQQPPDMIDVIANAKCALDVFGHPGAGPKVGCEPGGVRALEQMPLQSLALTRRKSGWSATGRNRLQRRSPAQTQITLPAPHAASIHSHPTSHFRLRQPLTKQFHSPLPRTLQFFRTAMRSDRSPPSHHIQYRTLLMQESIAPQGCLPLRFACFPLFPQPL